MDKLGIGKEPRFPYVLRVDFNGEILYQAILPYHDKICLTLWDETTGKFTSQRTIPEHMRKRLVRQSVELKESDVPELFKSIQESGWLTTCDEKDIRYESFDGDPRCGFDFSKELEAL